MRAIYRGLGRQGFPYVMACHPAFSLGQVSRTIDQFPALLASYLDYPAKYFGISRGSQHPQHCITLDLNCVETLFAIIMQRLNPLDHEALLCRGMQFDRLK
jgi:hypothetical protein